MQGITKVFPNGVIANDKIDLKINKGEIHALVGENGAGKSTLMKILYGLEQPSSGHIFINGKIVNIEKPKDAVKNGIGMVHQNFMLIPSFSVAENIVLGKEPTKGYLIDKVRAIKDTEEISRQYGLNVEANSIIEKINVGMRQRVEILKTLYRGAKILILDEPTAVLTPQETQDLFSAIRVLVNDGKTVIFITHKLDEVKEISDRVSIMRDGKIIDTSITKDISQEEIANLMVGRNIRPVEREITVTGKILLETKNLYLVDENGQKILKNITFNIRESEILGVAGIEGNGQTELIEVLTGLRKSTIGNILLGGDEITRLDVRSIREKGISHIPEDRLLNGIADSGSIQDNMIVDRYFNEPYFDGFQMNYKAIKLFASKLTNEFKIKSVNTDAEMNSLSGGNIQKVIVSRELSSMPSVLIAAQPTRGIDIGSTEFIRRILIERKKQGIGILLISADLTEIMAISDRIIVMNNGEITGCLLNSTELEEEEVGLYMLGIKKMESDELEEALQ